METALMSGFMRGTERAQLCKLLKQGRCNYHMSYSLSP